MDENRISRRGGVRPQIGVRHLILLLVLALVLLLMLARAGCSPYDTFAGAETKSLIEELTGCTVPSQAYEMRGFAYDARGRRVYAAFRIPPEVSSDVLAAFQHEGVETTGLSSSARIPFSGGVSNQEAAGANLFDRALVAAVANNEPRLTGPVHYLEFRQAHPPGYWVMLIFEEKGIVWFAAAVNILD